VFRKFALGSDGANGYEYLLENLTKYSNSWRECKKVTYHERRGLTSKRIQRREVERRLGGIKVEKRQGRKSPSTHAPSALSLAPVPVATIRDLVNLPLNQNEFDDVHTGIQDHDLSPPTELNGSPIIDEREISPEWFAELGTDSAEATRTTAGLQSFESEPTEPTEPTEAADSGATLDFDEQVDTDSPQPTPEHTVEPTIESAPPNDSGGPLDFDEQVDTDFPQPTPEHTVEPTIESATPNDFGGPPNFDDSVSNSNETIGFGLPEDIFPTYIDNTDIIEYITLERFVLYLLHARQRGRLTVYATHWTIRRLLPSRGLDPRYDHFIASFRGRPLKGMVMCRIRDASSTGGKKPCVFGCSHQLYNSGYV
jgi:hypothetical protein